MLDVTKKARRRFWTTPEEKVLRENYPSLGPGPCAALLPGRSVLAVYGHANLMGLKSPKTPKSPRCHWSPNPQLDAAIERVYADGKDGEVKALAKAWHRPRWWITQRARALGLIVPRAKEPPWTEAEENIVSTNAHKHPEAIRRALARAGFKRTETAVAVKRKRLGPTGRNADPDRYSSAALALCFGLACSKSVVLWIDKGWLRAERRGTARTERQGADEWSIHRRDVRRFVIENVGAVDFRRVDKVWLVDLLVNGDAR